MDRRLVRIKRLVAAGRYSFTLKADLEGALDGLTRQDVVESILSAQFLRMKRNFEGIPIYSKGVIREEGENESEYYILISGKRSIRSD